MERQQHMADCLHDEMYRKYAKAVNNLSSEIIQEREGDQNKDKVTVKDIFEDVLCFNFPEEN